MTPFDTIDAQLAALTAEREAAIIRLDDDAAFKLQHRINIKLDDRLAAASYLKAKAAGRWLDLDVDPTPRGACR